MSLLVAPLSPRGLWGQQPRISHTVRLSFIHPWTQHVVCTQNPRICSCTPKASALVVEVQGPKVLCPAPETLLPCFI